MAFNAARQSVAMSKLATWAISPNTNHRDGDAKVGHHEGGRDHLGFSSRWRHLIHRRETAHEGQTCGLRDLPRSELPQLFPGRVGPAPVPRVSAGTSSRMRSEKPRERRAEAFKQQWEREQRLALLEQLDKAYRECYKLAI